MILQRLISVYGSLPHHPGKGLLIDRLLPQISSEFSQTKLRTCDGVKFECDLRDKLARELYYYGFNRRDSRVLRTFITPDTVAVDAGANIGYFSLLMAKWGASKVYSFEPFPETAAKFRANLSLNPSLSARIELCDCALSNYCGTTNMTSPDKDNCGCNRIEGTGDIKVSTLDEFCRNKERIDLIKIDVEGTEIALLDGARETLSRLRPVLMVEINQGTLQHYGKNSAELVSMLKSFGYKLSVATRFGGITPLDHIPTLGEEPNVFAVL